MRSNKFILKEILSFVMAFISGLMLSSFVIGDRNLLVSAIAVLFPIASLWLTWNVAKGISRPWHWCYVAVILLLALAGLLLSVKGII